MTVMPNAIVLHIGTNRIERVTNIYKSQILLISIDMTQIYTRMRKGGVLQMLSFISGSEIQLHIFTIGTHDLQE